MRDSNTDTQFEYPNYTHRPGMRKFVEMDLPFILVAIVSWLIVGCIGYRLTDWTIAFVAFYTFGLCFHCQYVTQMKYRIGTEQLMFQRGLFSMKRDYIEMYRIVDFEERSNFLEMLFGLKTVTVYANDRTTPYLQILGVPIKMNIIDAIRERVAVSRKKNGIYEIANR